MTKKTGSVLMLVVLAAVAFGIAYADEEFMTKFNKRYPSSSLTSSCSV